MHKFVWILAASALAAFTYAEVKIKTTPVSRTAPNSGVEMYKTYCAVCHGLDGTGNGPAVPALKMAPPDLSKLTTNNGGKFPELRVYSTIRGEADIPAHATVLSPTLQSGEDNTAPAGTHGRVDGKNTRRRCTYNGLPRT